MEIKTYVGVIRKASDYIRSIVPDVHPQVAVILGSGLSKAVPPLENVTVIPYTDIPGYPRPTVAGHAGKLILGTYGKAQVAIMQGRFHYYEGHSMEQIALPIRVLEYLGLKTIIMTAAVGSMRPKIGVGDFVVVKDHINLMGRNPLRAFHDEEFGEMFVDLTQAYDDTLRKAASAICKKRRIRFHEGVYVAVGGPSYETPSEVKAFRMLGGDVVGMSVVPEVIVARQMGLRVSVLSWVSNMASGLSRGAISHPNVLALGDKVASNLAFILQDLIEKI